MKRANLACLFALLIAGPSLAQIDDNIRVLAMATPTVDQPEALQQLEALVRAWNESGIPGDSLGTVSVSLLNLGLPSLLVDHSGVGNVSQQLNEARNSPTLRFERDLYGADVVLVFTGNFGTGSTFQCGGAFAGNWAGTNPTFQAGANGLDLRNSETAYLAIVATRSPCKHVSDLNAAHEFAHILGAGHYDPRSQGGRWLYDDSRAYVQFWLDVDFQPQGEKTVVADGSPSICQQVSPDRPRCRTWLNRFSQRPPPAYIGNDDRENERAMSRTARSVANYRSGTGPIGQNTECSDRVDNDDDGAVDMADPDCSGASDDSERGSVGAGPGCGRPLKPTGIVNDPSGCEQLGDGNIWSKNFLRWNSPACAVYYEVWVSQPAFSAPYTFRYFNTPPFTTIWVREYRANVKISACNSGFGCSGLSNEFVTLDPC